MVKPNHHARIGDKFNKEIEEIKQIRIKSGKDNKKKSTRTLTNLITKHSRWPEIKRDMVKFIFNKNGKVGVENE